MNKLPNTQESRTVKVESNFTDIFEGKVKISSLADNRCETRDKWPLSRDPDRSWYHLHTNVKLFDRFPWLHGHRRHLTSVLPLSPWIYGLRPRKFYTSETSSCPGPYSTATCPRFYVDFTLGR